MALATFFLLCLALSSSCEAHKVLVIFGIPSGSHAILGAGVVRNLLKAGHEVTYITAEEYKNPPANLRQIDVSKNFESLPSDAINIEKIMEKKIDMIDTALVRHMMCGIASATLQNEAVKKLLDDPKEQFDVVVAEWMFCDVMSGVAQVFNCPLIWMYPIEVNAAILSSIDVAPSPAHSTDALPLEMPPFKFKQRVEELWSRIKAAYQEFMYYHSFEAKEYERLIVPYIKKRGRVPPPYYDVRYNASLVLGNSHVSMGQAYALPQNFKAIGGYHIDEEVKPLPEDLKKIMENSKNGVIYFSMGSNLKSKDWPASIKQDLLKMFGELKQTVLWKFEEDLPNVPKNVHILKWAPQPSILSHPKCVLFITHGGLLSTTETIHYGVPIIGIPVFGDQFVNVKRAEKKGFALKVKLSYKLADELKVAIDEMLHNPKYRQRVKVLSYIYHDRPVKPGAELVHWVRHVAELRGAPHLRSPAADVPLYQRLYLDLLVILSVVLLVVLIVLKKLCNLVCPKSNKQVKSSKKRN